MLVVEQFSGEFGHHLFSYQGVARKLSHSHDKTVVYCAQDMSVLYEDFADEIITDFNQASIPTNKSAQILREQDCKVNKGTGHLASPQEFVKYGHPNVEKYDLIIHARTKRAVMCPNLKDEVYDLIVKEMGTKYNIAFIGTKSLAYCPKGANDLRGLNLKELSNVIHSSSLVLGHSSGPIHFASLCGTPHLTWGGYRLRTFYRYAWCWNPFKTDCYIFEDLNDLEYLKRRRRLFNVPKDIFNLNHFNIIHNNNYRVPDFSSIQKAVEGILDE